MQEKLKKRTGKRGFSFQSGGGARQKKNFCRSVYFQYAIILLILALLIIPLYFFKSSITGFAILQTLFGGESSKLLTFSQSGNQTDYLKLPESANVTNSAFNLQGLILEVASLYQTLTQSDFDTGIYNNTLYNITQGYAQLNLSYDSGNYTSPVLDTNWSSSYQNLSWHKQRIQCPGNMSYIDKLNGFCIDKYESSTPGCEIVGNNCGNYTSATYCPTICVPVAGVLGGVDSTTGTTVVAYSKANVGPLVGVSQKQARQMCANAGKHLCTDKEWLAAANVQGGVYNLATDLVISPYYCVTGSTTYCNIAGNSNKACNTTRYVSGVSGCYSSEGVYDMIGNVWEWTNETVDVINPLGTATAGTGTANYYYPNNTRGWQTSTSAATKIYGDDYTYFPVTTTGRAVRRGGHWDYGAYAGPFCASLADAPSYVHSNVGFRCCSS